MRSRQLLVSVIKVGDWEHQLATGDALPSLLFIATFDRGNVILLKFRKPKAYFTTAGLVWFSHLQTIESITLFGYSTAAMSYYLLRA